MQISWTVYKRGERVTVGINFPPTPSLTIADVDKLIGWLQDIKQEMESDENQSRD